MPAYEIEIILNRQLADCLSIPVFITDTAGNLIFYNAPAEEVLGRRFEETGEMPVGIWSVIFKPIDEFNKPIPPKDLPMVKTLTDALPYHKSFWIKSLRGQREKIALTSYPIINREKKFLGAVAMFWKVKEHES
ncbi:MAG: PAS domain-containing protein [Panacibacter sp.]